MSELKESIIKAYDKVMSKFGIENLCIQWNHAYMPPREYKRHFHFVLTQSILPIIHDDSRESEMRMEFLPFPFRKLIIIGPNHKSKHSKEEEYYINKKYTKFIVP